MFLDVNKQMSWEKNVVGCRLESSETFGLGRATMSQKHRFGDKCQGRRCRLILLVRLAANHASKAVLAHGRRISVDQTNQVHKHAHAWFQWVAVAVWWYHVKTIILCPGFPIRSYSDTYWPRRPFGNLVINNVKMELFRTMAQLSIKE